MAVAAAAASLPAAAQVRVGVQVGAPVLARPYANAPAPVYYGAPRVYQQGYYDSRYDVRGRHEGWRQREWQRREYLRREEWRRAQWHREHGRHDGGWDGRR